MNLDTKHMFVGLLAAILALGVFVWNRSCILANEIEDLSRKMERRNRESEVPVAAPVCMNLKKELSPKTPKVSEETGEESDDKKA